jgi:hypothetical protein
MFGHLGSVHPRGRGQQEGQGLYLGIPLQLVRAGGPQLNPPEPGHPGDKGEGYVPQAYFDRFQERFKFTFIRCNTDFPAVTGFPELFRGSRGKLFPGPGQKDDTPFVLFVLIVIHRPIIAKNRRE